MSGYQTRPPAAGMSRPTAWRQIALGLAILFCGVVMGSAGTLVATRRVLTRGMPPADQAAKGLTQRMSAQLNLSPEQEKQVAQIVSGRLKQLRAARKEQFRLMHDEVAAVLTPEQAALWREGFERFQRTGPERPGRHHPPPAPGPSGDPRGPRSSAGCPDGGSGPGGRPSLPDGRFRF